MTGHINKEKGGVRRDRREQSRTEGRGGGEDKNVLRFAACHALQISREMRGSEMKRTEIGTAEGVQQLEVAGG